MSRMTSVRTFDYYFNNNLFDENFINTTQLSLYNNFFIDIYNRLLRKTAENNRLAKMALWKKIPLERRIHSVGSTLCAALFEINLAIRQIFSRFDLGRTVKQTAVSVVHK